MAKAPRSTPKAEAPAEAEKTAAPEVSAAEATDGEKVKSIVSSKYRDMYKGKEPDWLGALINAECTKTEERTRKKKSEDGEATETITEQVPVGVDTEKLLTLARNNGLNVDAMEAQSGNHGFAGRARMTIRNMLQTVAKQRHGLFNVGKTFVSAPAEWLTAKNAPEKATHGQDGTKIAKPVVAKEPAKADA